MTGFPRRTGGESFLWPHKNNHARLLADAETGPPLLPPLLASRLLAGAWPPRPLTDWKAPRRAEGAGTGQGMRGGGGGAPQSRVKAEEKGGGEEGTVKWGEVSEQPGCSGKWGCPVLEKWGPHPQGWGFFKNQLLDTNSFLPRSGSDPPPTHLSLGHTYPPKGALSEVGILAVPPVGVGTGQRRESWSRRGPVSCWPSWEGQD